MTDFASLRTTSVVAVFAVMLLAACSESDPPYAPGGGGNGPSRPSSSSSDDDDDEGEGSAGSSSSSGSDVDGVDVSGVPAFETGLNTDSLLDSLSADEVEMLCNRATNYFVDRVSLGPWERAYCYQTEARGAESMAECQLLVDTCLADTVFDYLPCSLEPLKHGASCAKPVGLYADCMRESVAIATAEVDFYQCSSLDSTTVPQQLEARPLACEELFGDCAELD